MTAVSIQARDVRGRRWRALIVAKVGSGSDDGRVKMSVL